MLNLLTLQGNYLASVHAGDSIGEGAVMSGKTRGASVVAFTPVLLLKVEKLPFISIFGKIAKVVAFG